MAEKIETFWMVMVDHAEPPRVRHRSEDDAMAEARRLANKLPGRKVFVLGCVGAMIVKDPVQWLPGDRIPF